MLNPDIHNSARRFVESREPKHQRQIVSKILALCQDPKPHDSQPLKGTRLNERRATIGEYRIIYRVEDSDEPGRDGTLHVDAVGKRNDDEVYRRFGKQ